MAAKNLPFSKEQLETIIENHPTPFHIYDEKAIRENARYFKKAFSWNEGFKEYYAIKAAPNPSKAHTSISPNRCPPCWALPPRGCCVINEYGPIDLACILSSTMW